MKARPGKKNDSVYLESRLPNAFPFIRIRAFAYNNNNTCSAVSVALALNYLALQTGEPFVPTECTSELLDKDLPNSANALEQKYPRAGKLSSYLIKACGMRAASFAFLITRAFRKYVRTILTLKSKIKLRWTLLPRSETIKKQIDSGLPILITTTFAGEFSWHTMLVYGYRESYGKTELLVHSGWYKSKFNKSYALSGETHFYQKEIWLDKKLATFAYYFSFD